MTVFLFGGNDTRRFGGWEDFVGYADNVSEARRRAREMKLVWYQIVAPNPDIRAMTIVASRPKREE